MNENYQLIAIIFIITIFAHFILKFVIRIINKLIVKSKSQIDDYMVSALVLPAKCIIWLFFIYASVGVLQAQYSILNNILTYIEVSIMLTVLWALIKFIDAIKEYLLLDNDKFDNDIIHLSSKLIKLIFIVLTLLSIFQFLGFAISSILTFGGVGGMVIGFAAKDMLANIFGGLMISLDKPFSVGDWVRVGDIEGTVEKIGWRMTMIMTFSKNPIYVPNGMFATKSIETPSRMTYRRIMQTIGLRYEDIGKAEVIISQIKELLNNNIHIDQKQPLRVNFDSFNDSSIDISIYAFTKIIDKASYENAKEKILFDIAKIVSTNNADFAYPTQTLKIDK